ncbi:intermembrane phospholipid transport protein YdbH family protein [Rubellicoccus peritrichatus]|uniref:YdbH domain-containing protein n=1 Tax=Rubellicoccus peritrichatus TaxID=3080537 RepID=A0AAQ3LFE0_9BACT|nr:YdbH domain-containing protein [Puniceicoccus sp. CR14]WOO42865.1 YdbH domain-containing protein [Puniceicoccus sp. CR14]
MRRFFRWIIIGLSGLILILLGLVVLVPTWLPWLAEVKVNNLLKEKGATLAELKFHQFDLSGINLEIEALSKEGITFDEGIVELDYSIDSVLRREVESLVLSDLDVSVDLPLLLDSRPVASTVDSARVEDSGIDNFTMPMKWFALEDATLTLEAGDWSKALSLQANLDRGHPSLFFFEGKDDSDGLVVSGEVDQSVLSGEATFKLDSENPVFWLELVDQLGLYRKPKGLEVVTGALGLEGAVRIKEKLPEQWTALGSLALPDIKFNNAELTAELTNFGGRGNAGQFEKVWFGLFDASLSYDGYVASLSEMTLETLDLNQTYAKLTGLELSGSVPVFGLGDTSFEGGAIGTLVEGPWAQIQPPVDLDLFSVKLIMPAAPLMLFTEFGSITGNFEMEGEIGSGPSRDIDLSAVFSDVELSHSAASFSAQTFSLNATGKLEKQLSAVIELLNGKVVWAEGAGILSQIGGEIYIDSLTPLALLEPQVLTFSELRQGEVVISDGSISIAYQADPDDAIGTMMATLGGDFAGGRLLAEVLVTASESLNVEAKLVFDDIELETLAAYFPEFNGRIQGKVSGELPVRLEGNRLIVQPGFLEMKPGQTGTFQYTRVGWLTQDPGLDPEAYVEGKDLLSLMKEPNGAAILTELAMRDLRMTAFRMDVMKPDTGDRRVIIRIEGDGEVKEVTVPVIQDIRVGGDVKETINVLLKLKEKIAF